MSYLLSEFSELTCALFHLPSILSERVFSCFAINDKTLNDNAFHFRLGESHL